jgi:hypothetical protein
MHKTDMTDWLKQEFSTVQLATTDETISQIIDNAIRYWNTHSAYKWVRMFDLSNLQMENDIIGTANGVSLTYTLNTSYGSVSPGTFVVRIDIADQTIVIAEQSGGTLYGTYQNPGDITGTIDHSSGLVTLTFPAPPNEDSQFRADYYFAGSFGSATAANPSGAAIPIPPEFKYVTAVYPAVSPQLLWQDNTLWKLFGLTILDNVTSDLIMMTQAFQNYQIYVGTDFRFTYEHNPDPTKYGTLYYTGNPYSNARLCVVGSKRLMPNENITSEHILDWLLYYAKALLKMCEGNMLRKADIINVRNDGQTLMDEGKQEKLDLEKRLAEEGRWLIMAKRF